MSCVTLPSGAETDTDADDVEIQTENSFSNVKSDIRIEM